MTDYSPCPNCGKIPTVRHWSQFGWLYLCKCKQGSFFGDERDKKPVEPKQRKRK